MYILTYMSLYQQLVKKLCSTTDAQDCSHSFANAKEHLNYNRLPEALQELIKLKYLFELLLDTNDILLGNLYNEIGMVLNRQKLLDQSLEYYKQASIIISINCGFNCKVNATIYNNIAEVYLDYYEYTKNQDYYSQSMKYYNKLTSIMKIVYHNDTVVLKKYYKKLGHRLGIMHYTQAFICFSKALTLVEIVEKTEYLEILSFINELCKPDCNITDIYDDIFGIKK